MRSTRTSTPRALAASRIDRHLAERNTIARPLVDHAVQRAPVITISYAIGIPGKEIAARVSGELGFQVFDREVLKAVENDTCLGDRLVEALDRGKRSALAAWIQGWIDFDHRIVDSKSFHHMVSRVIRGIGLRGSAVILGRGSNFVLKGTGAFRVRLIAPLEERIRSVAAGVDGEPGMSPSRARAYLAWGDDERRAFIRKHFRADIDDPNGYDVVFQLRRVSAILGANLLLDAFRREEIER
jgi:cytidylate kinase